MRFGLALITIIFGVLSCTNIPATENLSAYSVDYGLRHRYFDGYDTFSIAFWITADTEQWERFDTITLYEGDTAIHTLSGIDELYPDGETKSMIFFQVFGITNADELLIQTSDGEYSYELTELNLLEGIPGIEELETQRSKDQWDRYTFTITGMEPGYDYMIDIYGPDDILVFATNVTSAEVELNLRGLVEGEHLIGIYKRDLANHLNLISREYTYYVRNGK